MPTNRPFFSNFLAVFRAHSTLSKSTSTTSTTPASPTSPTSTQQPPTFSPPSFPSPRPITQTTKTPSQGATTAAVQAATSLSHARSPISHSPPTTTTFKPAAQRRGSDSSSDGGFRDALGGEKWFVGGRTAAGEERYYRLGMVRRERSGDRLSMDRLSL